MKNQKEARSMAIKAASHESQAAHMARVQRDKLEGQLNRFINSGFKESRFTVDLYEMLHVHSGMFIAHFNKDGFYRVRFTQEANETINNLLSVGKPSLKPLCVKLAVAMREKLHNIVVEHVRSSVLAGDK